jgi:hypothetical protein
MLDIFSNLGPEAVVEQIVRLLLGLGCLFSCVNLMRYFEFNQRYMVTPNSYSSVDFMSQILINALGHGLPNVARFLLGAFPIFVGYALFGMLYFSQVSGRVTCCEILLTQLCSVSNI